MLFTALVWPHLFGNVVWAPRFLKDTYTADRGCPKTCNNFPVLKDLNYNGGKAEVSGFTKYEVSQGEGRQDCETWIQVYTWPVRRQQMPVENGY